VSANIGPPPSASHPLLYITDIKDESLAQNSIGSAIPIHAVVGTLVQANALVTLWIRGWISFDFLAVVPADWKR